MKIVQQILFEEHTFQWLLEEKTGRRHKNLSQTVNEILRNYQIMIRATEQAYKKVEIEEKRKKEAEDFAKSYRTQVISKP